MKNSTLFFLAFITPVFFLFSSCKETAAGDKVVVVNQDSVKMQIVALEEAFAKASNARDVDGVAAYYADDAQSLADNEPTWVGKEAIKAGIKRDFDADTTNSTISFQTTGIWADGKYATETGTSTITSADGKTVRTGKYMTLFELRDGKYIAIRDIWNSDTKSTPEVQ